jgi:hypothetical protein
MVFPPKTDIICFQNLAQFRARRTSFGTDISQGPVFSHRLILVLRIFSATFFRRSNHILTLTQPKISKRSVPEFKSGTFSKCRSRFWAFFAFFQRNLFYTLFRCFCSRACSWCGFLERKLFIYECCPGIINFCHVLPYRDNVADSGWKPRHHQHQNVPSVRAGACRNRYKKETNQYGMLKKCRKNPINLWGKCHLKLPEEW